MRPGIGPSDWKLFLKSLPLQPAAAFILLGLLAAPLARLSPWLMRASCDGRLRDTVSATFLFVYIALGIPSICAAYYLGFARRRLPPSRLRTFADLSFALIMAVGALKLAILGARLASRWTSLQPGLAAVRDACWK